MHAMLAVLVLLCCTAGLVAELTRSPLDVLDGPQARQSDLEFGEVAPYFRRGREHRPLHGEGRRARHYATKPDVFGVSQDMT